MKRGTLCSIKMRRKLETFAVNWLERPSLRKDSMISFYGCGIEFEVGVTRMTVYS